MTLLSWGEFFFLLLNTFCICNNCRYCENSSKIASPILGSFVVTLLNRSPAIASAGSSGEKEESGTGGQKFNEERWALLRVHYPESVVGGGDQRRQTERFYHFFVQQRLFFIPSSRSTKRKPQVLFEVPPGSLNLRQLRDQRIVYIPAQNFYLTPRTKTIPSSKIGLVTHSLEAASFVLPSSWKCIGLFASSLS